LLGDAKFDECGNVHIPSDTAAGLVEECAHKLDCVCNIAGEIVTRCGRSSKVLV
jgi:hypothetical protein